MFTLLNKRKQFYCSLKLLLFAMICTFSAQAQLTVQVGTDDDETQFAPINSCASVNYTQIIYTADQLSAAGIPTTGVTISKIKFNLKDLAGSTEFWNEWKVYMAHTSETEFDEDYEWIDPTSFTEVFDGGIGATGEGWFELVLSTPFVWNGTDNLAIAVSENVEGGWCTSLFEATDVDDRQIMNFGRWGEEIDPLDPGTGEDWEINRVSFIPNIKFVVTPTDECSGVADAGTASGIESICALHPFAVSVTGSSIGAGLIAQWQSAPAAAGPWTDIPDATASEYYTMDGISAPTFYRFYVHCSESGTSDTSNVVSVALNPPMECYCEPDPDGCGPIIDDFSTTDAINNISNLGTGCDDGGYSNYTDQFIEAAQGTIFSYEIVLGDEGWSGAVKLWVDWNQDGFFSDTEMLYASDDWEDPSAVISGSYEVPFSAVAGDTRMRVKVYSDIEFDACDDEFNSETEDYKFTVVVPDPCEDVTFTEVEISGPEDICSFIPFTIISSGTPVATGIDRVWQSRVPSETGDWVTLTGEESLNYESTGGISVPTDYRYIISCSESGESDTSNVITIGIRPGTECYCTPIYEGGCEWISIVYVGLGTIDNNTEGECSLDPPGYSDYHDMSTELMQGVTYTANVTASEEADMGYVIWIDYNDDGFFDNTTERAATVGSLPGAIADEMYGISLPIPSDATLGAHRMRIRAVSWESGFDIDPCSEYWDGEAEDYTVNIIPQPPCAEVIFPETAMAIALPGQLCSGGNVILNLNTIMPIALGITYQWLSSTSETGTFTAVGAPVTNPMIIQPLTATTYFKCVILCEGEPVLTSEVVAVPVITPELLTTVPAASCGPGEVTLGAEGNDGSVIRWYEVPDGGYPVAEGGSFTTPELTTTTQYYVVAAAGSGPALDTLGKGSSLVSSWNKVSPYFHENGGYKHQYLVRGSELTALGVQPGNLTSLTFLASGGGSGTTYNDFSIKIGNTTISEMADAFVDGPFTDVFSAGSVTTASGPNTYIFGTPFAWDGVSNIIVQVCWSNGEGGGTSTNVRYHNTTFPAHYCGWSNDASADEVCTEPEELDWEVTFERPNMIFSSFSGCESERVAVTATIHPVPVQPFAATDTTACGDIEQSITLNAGNPGSSYLWNTGATTQSLKILSSGPYSVTITNEFDCSISDAINVNLLPKPVVFLGNDTSICEGGSLMLDASNPGAEYYWSDGSSSQSLTVIAGGTYRVLVTNSDGCMTGDTINIGISGIVPSIESIIVDNLGAYTFAFSPLNPQHITSYSWDFGDGSLVSNSESPTHTYASTGNYTVTLTLTNDCGPFIYTTTANIVGLNTIVVDDDLLTLYPNPARETAVIENKGDFKMKEVTVMNILGQVLTNEKIMGDKHQLYLSGYASGIYTVRVLTDKGYVVRKFEIVK